VRSANQAVCAARPSAAALSMGRPSGIGQHAAAGARTCSAKAPYSRCASTAMPGAIPLTPGPIAVTMPAAVLPGTKGSGGLT
jgi:hypothetical protein